MDITYASCQKCGYRKRTNKAPQHCPVCKSWIYLEERK
jgi:predicted Zn-ribbon and HTH transcriptional regulator